MASRWPEILLLCLIAAASGNWILFLTTGGLQELSEEDIKSYIAEDLRAATHFTSIPWLDAMLKQNTLVNVVLLTASSPISAQTRPMMAFLLEDMTVAIAVLVRSLQRRELTSAMRLALLLFWLALTANLTSAFVLPLYSLVHLRSLTGDNTSRITARRLDGVTSTFGALIGFGLPAFMSLDPLQHGAYSQLRWIAVSTAFPMCVTVVECFRHAMYYAIPANGHVTLPKGIRVADARNAFLLLGSGAATAHVLTRRRFSLGIGEVLVPTQRLDMAAHEKFGKLMAFMQADCILTNAWMILLAIIVSTGQYHKKWYMNCLSIGVSTWAIGPGATFAFVWALREGDSEGISTSVTKSTAR